jgi:putative Mg2+ transporter-C (MgtC) family protein
MPITPSWTDIAIRLVCALMVAAILGMNRTEHGRAAGLRTSILVCLAACIAMLQVNLLLSLSGRTSDSFVMNDLMRLPLGILSGIGFIGAGAIVRRDNLVMGVTTATMWFLTVLGLCFGGGQIFLGLTGGAVGLAVLAGLKQVEHRLRQDRQGRLRIVVAAGGPDEREIRTVLQNGGLRIASCGFSGAPEGAEREWTCDLQWRAVPDDTAVPDSMQRLLTSDGVTRVEWTPATPTGL